MIGTLVIRAFVLFFALAAGASAETGWIQSVEFPWNSYPRQLWERELVWLKNIGIAHLSLPQGSDASGLSEVIGILRRLNMEADLEGPVPDALQPLMRAHGGPLTDAAPRPVRLSILSPDALSRSRGTMISAGATLIWTDVEETFGSAGFHPGAVNFAGQETAATIPLRRNAQLAHYWSETLPTLHVLPEIPDKTQASSIATVQFAATNGASFVAVTNSSAKDWAGEVKASYAALKRGILLPNVTVPSHDTRWLPVDLPLSAGSLCRNCSAFATVDHLVYATSEITAMEYENGILAMEFSAPSAGEVLLQLSREPTGPLVAGGKPSGFDWDEHTLRARLPIPKGSGPGDHVRIGLAIEAPEATAFFDNARVLLIGETNNLQAEFSSAAIAQRSRLRIAPELSVTQDAKSELQVVYRVPVPATGVHGDHAELAIEADGLQLSHSHPQLLRPASLRFADAIAVQLSANSSLPLFPSTIPVNQRSGRDVTIAIRNNAQEIRNFRLEITAQGLDFSPRKIDVTVGASASRDVSFRVFATGTTTGLHRGEARLSGAASATEPVDFLVIPSAGAVSYSSGPFTVLESAKERAALFPGRWFEFLNKENGQNALPAGGIVFSSGALATRGDALVVAGQKVLRMADLEQLAPKPRH